MRLMTSRELRKQRREAERKARKLAYQQSRAAAASAQEICGAGSLAGEPVPRPAFSGTGLALVFPPTAPAKPGPTGPTSPEGKAISSGNSLKHGLASGRVIIPGEDPAEFEALLSDLVQQHAPANETESLLVQQMAQSWWLMQRAIRIQNEAFTETRVDTHKLALFLRYQTTHERAFYRALNTLLKLSRARGVRGTSASAPKEAVSSRRKAVPEFVSQSRTQTHPENEFVSQNRPHTSLSQPVRFANDRPMAVLQADR